MRFRSARSVARCWCVIVCCAVCGGCRSVEKMVAPSNFRDWAPEQAVLPYAEFHGNRVTVRNVRNCQYFADDLYVLDYYDKTFDLESVRAVDFIMVPFDGMPSLAHTMLSFELAGPDGGTQHLAVSVEARRERNQTYGPARGSARQFELMYVIGDERDVIGARTNVRNEQVYLYRSTAPPQTVKLLLVDVLARANQLTQEPEFYNTFTNNCTTNIVRHIRRIDPHRFHGDLRTLLPGYSDKLAYDQGLIVRRGSFEQTKQQAHVNPAAQRYAGREDFSTWIRRR